MDGRVARSKKFKDFQHVDWDEIELLVELDSRDEAVYRITRGHAKKGDPIGGDYRGYKYLKQRGVLIPVRLIEDYLRKKRDMEEKKKK